MGWMIMQDQNNSYSGNSFNNSVSKNSKITIAAVSVAIIVVAIVVSTVFLITTNKNNPNNSVSAPSKICVKLQEKALNAQKSLVKALSDDDVISATSIKTSGLSSYSNETKKAFEYFESSLKDAKSHSKEKIPNCVVKDDSGNSASVENNLLDKIDSFNKNRDTLLTSAKKALKTGREEVSNKLLELVRKGQELIDKTKNVPIFGAAKAELKKVVDAAGKALIKSNNNSNELNKCVTDLRNALKGYLEKIKKFSENFTKLDGNGYPLNAPHPKDDQGGYIPMGRSQNPESSKNNN